MERLTMEKPVAEMGMYELAHNCMFVKDGYAWYRDFEKEISLRNMIREIMAQYEGEYDKSLDDDELLDTVLMENLQYPVGSGVGAFIAIFNMLAWSHADLRERLKEYENTGLEPAEVAELKERTTWIPADQPPETDDYVLLSFANLTIPVIGRYKGDDDYGGSYYDCGSKPLSFHGFIVNGWMPLPERKDSENE